MLSYLLLSLFLFYCVSAGQMKHWLCVKTPPPRFRDLNTSCPAEQCYSLHLFACYNEDCCALNIQPEGNTSSDVGGNYGDAGSVKNIYVVEEPKVISGNDTLPLLAKLHYNWDVYDTETLMVDPTGDVILISKVLGGRGLVGHIPSIAFYTAQQFPFPQSYNITNSTTLNLPLTDDVDPLGGDISPNGREVVLRTHHKIYYWMVNNREYLKTLNTTEPWEVPQKTEPQGEAVCWDTRGEGYYTLSERENQPIYYFRRLF